MNQDELREAMKQEEEIEYHLEGVEQNAHLLPGPGWYPCMVNWIGKSGNVEISFTSPELDGLGVTVLEKNISIAFRRKAMNMQQFRVYVKRLRQTEHDPNKLLVYRDVGKWLFECGGSKSQARKFIQNCIEQGLRKHRKAQDEAVARVEHSIITGYVHLRDVLDGTVLPYQQAIQDEIGTLWEPAQ